MSVDRKTSIVDHFYIWVNRFDKREEQKAFFNQHVTDLITQSPFESPEQFVDNLRRINEIAEILELPQVQPKCSLAYKVITPMRSGKGLALAVGGAAVGYTTSGYLLGTGLFVLGLTVSQCIKKEERPARKVEVSKPPVVFPSVALEDDGTHETEVKADSAIAETTDDDDQKAAGRPEEVSDIKKESESFHSLSNSEFLTWLKQDIKRLGSTEHTEKLISIIKNAEVEEEEIRAFYADLSESVVLQILFLTQTSNSFNAIDEKIIEKALIFETNFIQAVNKKCPHRNPILRTKIEQRLLGPSIFRHSMEEKEIVQIGTEFFVDLKRSGRLLTSEQFASQTHPKRVYRNKGNDLGRILGANYIKKAAEELGLKHIKVPKKIAVVHEKEKELKVHVCQTSLELSCSQVTVYAEDITPLERGTTREEVTELLKILEATGFGDFLGLNFFLGKNQHGEEGIYFIDTEYTNFRHFPFLENSVDRAITCVVQKKDWDWINQPDEFPRYRDRNQERVDRYRELYDIKEPCLENLMKTYVPETERRKKDVKFTYALG